MKVEVVNRDGKTLALDWSPEQTLMECLRDENLVLASCNGHAICATCHVWVDPEFFAKLPPRQGDEIAPLEQEGNFREGASRLACQVRFAANLQGLRVTVAPLPPSLGPGARSRWF